MQTSEENTSKKKNGKATKLVDVSDPELVPEVFVEEARVPRDPAHAIHVEIERVVLGDNYRKSVDEDYIAGLAATIVRDGQLEPILVRPRGDEYEIVFGECRWRAIKKAQLPTIWLYARDLNDLEVLELQLLENMKRKDPHPLDEAEAFEKLRRKHGYSVERIAQKVEKTKAYVYAALKLCELSPESREAFYAGKLNASTALTIARIPHAELQAKAIAEIGPTEHNPEGLSARRALELVHEKFMLRLVDAPFDRADANLAAGCGACGSCPKRTGNQKELFADLAGLEMFDPKDDMCTDPVCFDAKRTAHIAIEKTRLEATGVTVVESKAKTSPWQDTKPPAGFVSVKAWNNDAGKSYGDLAKKVGKKVEIERAVMIDRDGKKVDLIAKSSVDTLLKAAGVTPREDERPKPVDPVVKAAHEAANDKARKAVLDVVAKKGMTDELLRIVWDWSQSRSSHAELVKVRGNALAARIVGDVLDDDWQDDALRKLCAEYKVDLKKLIAAELAAVKAGAPVRGVCSKCGCTEDEACEKGCHWVDEGETLCSSCAPMPAKDKKAVARAASKSKPPKKKPAKAKSTKKRAAKNS